MLNLEIRKLDKPASSNQVWFDCLIKLDGFSDVKVEFEESPRFLDFSEFEIIDIVKTRDEQTFDRVQSALSAGSAVALNGVVIQYQTFKA